MKRALSPVVALVSLFAALAPAFVAPVHAQVRVRHLKPAHGKTIYGEDDRLDVYQAKDPRFVGYADSTVALFQAGDLTSQDAGMSYRLSTQGFGQSQGLCKDERFWDQPIGAFCSGSLVAPDLLMTAGHCVTNDGDCQNVRFVFGFTVYQPGKYPSTVPAGEVFGCKEIVGRQQNNTGADFALLRLDRPVEGHRPLAIDRGAGVSNGEPVLVIGHPTGLPTKIAGGAKVRDASPDGYFVANTDTYAGNSGSPVFSQTTGLIEGILVRGDQDFVFDDKKGCYVSYRCPSDGCRGEDSTKASAVASLIPRGGMSLETARVATVHSDAFAGLLKSAGVESDSSSRR